jgi:hypothetical protein
MAKFTSFMHKLIDRIPWHTEDDHRAAHDELDAALGDEPAAPELDASESAPGDAGSTATA